MFLSYRFTAREYISFFFFFLVASLEQKSVFLYLKHSLCMIFWNSRKCVGGEAFAESSKVN